MIVYNQDQTISFSIFRRFPTFVCTMTTRKVDEKTLLASQNISPNQLANMEQKHTTNVVYVDSSIVAQNTDGLLTNTPNVFLRLSTADCVPLFFFDPVKQIVGVAHAGWRGTLGKIGAKVIRKMVDRASNASDIRVAIGPHIGGCCYDVSAERAKLFISGFSGATVAFQNEGKWYVDLGLANKYVLTQAGILNENIDAPITCTSCQNDRFFSYRKDGSHTGEILGIIGIRNDL